MAHPNQHLFTVPTIIPQVVKNFPPSVLEATQFCDSTVNELYTFVPYLTDCPVALALLDCLKQKYHLSFNEIRYIQQAYSSFFEGEDPKLLTTIHDLPFKKDEKILGVTLAVLCSAVYYEYPLLRVIDISKIFGDLTLPKLKGVLKAVEDQVLYFNENPKEPDYFFGDALNGIFHYEKVPLAGGYAGESVETLEKQAKWLGINITDCLGIKDIVIRKIFETNQLD